MKKWTKPLLREQLNIYNPHNVATAAGRPLYIDYTPRDTGRGGHPSYWSVVGIKINTDPEAPWYNNGCKTFYVYSREEKEPQLQATFAWCKEKYGIAEWERDPFGAYQIKGTLEKLTEILNAKPKPHYSTKRTTDGYTSQQSADITYHGGIQ